MSVRGLILGLLAGLGVLVFGAAPAVAATGYGGLLATLRVLFHSHGTSAPKSCPRGLVLVLATTLGAFAFTAAPASAAFLRHPFLGSFGPEGPLSVTSFADVQGVAVDAEGDVYVYDARASGGSIYKFNAAGEPAHFSALGANVNAITGVGEGGGGESEIAVSSAGPTKGDIYLTYFGLEHIAIYEPDGDKSPGELSGVLVSEVPGAPWEKPCGAAVDPAGDVYAGLYTGHVNRYAPTGHTVLNTDYDGSLSGLLGICQVAADPEGNVYAETEPRGPVMQYKASQFNTEGTAAVGALVDPTGTTLAADPVPSSHVLYIDERNLIAEYETSGKPKRLSAFGESGPGQLTESFGVAAGASGEVYASNGGGLVNIYGAPRPESPSVEEQSVTEVTATTATLHTQVNPALADTHYYFQWGTANCTEHPSACTDVPASPGVDIGSGDSDVNASTELRGLTPSATYHYSVVGTNEFGPAYGEDRTFTTQAAGTPFALPDNRQYELVSPPDKYGTDVSNLAGFSGGGLIEAAEDGSAITYITGEPPVPDPPDNANGTQVVSRRGSSGWSSQVIDPSYSAGSGVTVGTGTPYRAFSSDLSIGLLEFPKAGLRSMPQEPLSNEVPAGITEELYLRNTPTTDFQPLVTSVQPGAEGASYQEFEGASPDLSHVVFTSALALTPNAPAGVNLYEWSAGQLQLVNVPPDGTPDAGMPGLGGRNHDVTHAISDDGSRVVWTDRAAPTEPLYVRDMVVGKTVQADTSHVVPGAGGDSSYETASSDDTKIFFTNNEELTANANTGGGQGNDLYVFEVGSGELTDLTADHNVADTNGAEVAESGSVLGASEDGDYVYFVAAGNLASGATSGEPNLYFVHYDSQEREWEKPAFIATLSSGGNPNWNHRPSLRGDTPDWTENGWKHTSRVSPNGRYVAFMSTARLTSYDSRDATSGQPDAEAYLYDVLTRRLVCVSCNPTGARPVGERDEGNLAMDRTGAWVEGEQWLAAMIPAFTPIDTTTALYPSRALSDEGRVFFDSAEGLVPQDTNGKEDVYEYEPEGVGSCQTAGGCVYLISGGAGPEDSTFLDASANGDDVFFRTSDRLVPQDYDHEFDVYDAHVCTTSVPCFAPPPVTPPPCASGDACKPSPTPQPTLFGAPASATFAGNGNVSPSVSAPSVKAKSTKKPRRHGKKRPRKHRSIASKRRHKAKKSGAKKASSRWARS